MKIIHDSNMKTIFYIISVLMIIIWALSYFVYSINATIHLLLVTSILLGIAGFLEK